MDKHQKRIKNLSVSELEILAKFFNSPKFRDHFAYSFETKGRFIKYHEIRDNNDMPKLIKEIDRRDLWFYYSFDITTPGYFVSDGDAQLFFQTNPSVRKRTLLDSIPDETIKKYPETIVLPNSARPLSNDWKSAYSQGYMNNSINVEINNLFSYVERHLLKKNIESIYKKKLLDIWMGYFKETKFRMYKPSIERYNSLTERISMGTKKSIQVKKVLLEKKSTPSKTRDKVPQKNFKFSPFSLKEFDWSWLFIPIIILIILFFALANDPTPRYDYEPPSLDNDPRH